MGYFFVTVPINMVMFCQTLVIFIERYFIQNGRTIPYLECTRPILILNKEQFRDLFDINLITSDNKEQKFI